MPLTAIAFLMAFVAGCILAFARHPIYGLLAYVATFYFEPSGQWWGGALPGIRWEFLPAVVTLVAMVVRRRKLQPSPFFHSGCVWGIVAFVIWLAIQSAWALDPAAQHTLLMMWINFLIVVFMICGCVDSWRHLKLFLWTHVIGCLYLGWLAYTMYTGGRFQGFGSGALAEANAGALQLVTGAIVAASLFLAAGWREKVITLVPLALIANGIVTTVSRSGFLAASVSTVVFNLFTPRRLRFRVVVLSVLGVAAFLSLTTANYWSRMRTIEYEGAEVKGVDTGGGRLEIIAAQWKMFHEYPLGCGHTCTAVLSPKFLSANFLSEGQRASHNTFMTMLVEHGVPGALLYVALLIWTLRTLLKVARLTRGMEGIQAAALPAIAGVMTAITVGDLFVQYPKLEVRVWFIGLLIVYQHLANREVSARSRAVQASIAPARLAVGIN